MHELQAELGEDWILRFSVQDDEAWLTAEKADGSQRIEAPTASVSPRQSHCSTKAAAAPPDH